MKTPSEFGSLEFGLVMAADARTHAPRKFSDASYGARLSMSLPFVVPIPFLFDKQLLSLFGMPGIDGGSIPDVPLIGDQFSLLSGCRDQSDVFEHVGCKVSDGLSLFDFQIFKVCVWVALSVCLIRICVDLWDLRRLDFYAERFDAGGSFRGYLAGYLLFGPIGLYCFTQFKFAYAAPLGRYLIEFSPRGFLAMESFLVCGAAAFSGEAFLLVAWIVFRRAKAMKGRLVVQEKSNGQ